jgi:two-component system, OmpR family, osmolarity sensor histidine kinase EnvZ
MRAGQGELGRIGGFINRTIVPPSLLWRSILIVVLPLLILQIVLTVIFYNRHWDVVTRWLASGVAGEVALAVELLDEAATTEERRRILARFREFHDLRLSLEPGGELTAAVERAGIGTRRLSHIDSKVLQGF